MYHFTPKQIIKHIKDLLLKMSFQKSIQIVCLLLLSSSIVAQEEEKKDFKKKREGKVAILIQSS